MALEIKLSQKLSQTLVMTPQLQQAIKLLQLGRMEYLEVIERELLENPLLETTSSPGEEYFTEGSDPFSEDHSSSKSDKTHAQEETEFDFEQVEPSFKPEVPLNGAIEGAFDFRNNYSSGSGRNNGEGSYNSLESWVSSPEGLSSHLLWQLRTSELAPSDLDIAAQIVGNLDRNGYLRASLQEIALECGRSEEEVQDVLSIVQSMDPPGIAARDLRECLLIQLDQSGLRGTLAWVIVENYLPDLELRRYELIAKREQVAVEQIYRAVKEIQKLEPRPGRPFADEAPVYIVPDVYVRKVGDDYVISLNENGMPKIRMNSDYQDLLTNSVGSNPDKEYLQDRFRAAAWLLKSIQQRQQTIYKVTESIMKFQRAFLDQGVAFLKPLVLREVAADVKMHESTVSRVTTNKYVHTPQGIFELKFFFSSGLMTEEGEVSSESIKNKIRDFIAAENPRKPLSDQAIVALLRAQGVDIARRTVAKYREMMNVLSSSRRKRLF